jgi:endonuclease/exonuclease/phosphatase family metal-dependent hydrolase
MLVRTWNLFHGNVSPPERRAFLKEMVELVSADAPDVVFLQEVPVWALRYLERWSGMQSIGAVAARPLLGSAALGRWITELHHGLFRSAVTGQANAILVARAHTVGDGRSQQVSRSGERRVVQGVRVDGTTVVNFHLTGGAPADEQFRRVVDFADDRGPVILGGDANMRPGQGSTYDVLRQRGYSDPLPGSIDQILVRGLPSTPPVAWPEERRRLGTRVLSDHAPVELRAG